MSHPTAICAQARTSEEQRVRHLDADRLECFDRPERKAAYQARKQDKAAAAEHKRGRKLLEQAAKANYRDRDRG